MAPPPSTGQRHRPEEGVTPRGQETPTTPGMLSEASAAASLLGVRWQDLRVKLAATAAVAVVERVVRVAAGGWVGRRGFGRKGCSLRPSRSPRTLQSWLSVRAVTLVLPSRGGEFYVFRFDHKHLRLIPMRTKQKASPL